MSGQNHETCTALLVTPSRARRFLFETGAIARQRHHTQAVAPYIGIVDKLRELQGRSSDELQRIALRKTQMPCIASKFT
jgi:hypothetical protein